MKKKSYIQNEYEKVFDCESPFSDKTTFQIIKTFYLGERLKLILLKVGSKT